MTDLLNIIDDAMDTFERAVNELPRVNASKIGLDTRAGYVYVDTENELIIAKNNYIRSLDYYGGFEYVDDDAVTEFGDYKIYGTMHDRRVLNAIDFYLEHNDED